MIQKGVELEEFYLLESGVITKLALEPYLMYEFSEKDVLLSVIFSERSTDPAISASIVKVFPKPIS